MDGRYQRGRQIHAETRSDEGFETLERFGREETTMGGIGGQISIERHLIIQTRRRGGDDSSEVVLRSKSVGKGVRGGGGRK